MQSTPPTPTPATGSGDAAGPAPLRVGILGARTVVQGIGPYVARAFRSAGCHVCAVAGTREETAREAAEDLSRRFDLRCTAHAGLQRMLDAESLDVLAICSPMQTHREALALASGADIHVLCEKPLVWDAGCRAPGQALADEVRAVAEGFVARGRLLALNTQWPTTLAAYRRLHPDALRGGVRRFEMLMSPKGGGGAGAASGERLVVDAAPHAVSMLRALAGAGRVEAAIATRPADVAPARSALDLAFRWRRARSATEDATEDATEVLLRLRQCPEQPRPAGYAVNGAWAERRVELPAYTMSLVSEDARSEPLDDPLDSLVAGFVEDVAAGRRTDVEALVESMTALRDLVAATEGVEDTA
ncbi:MAG: Gfo/Idh/MocA family protein [Planctomycetota bacterium]|jgi:predicted dehydrogenase